MLSVCDISFHGLLSNISFNAYPGEVLVIIGSNGAGKSTLLNAISSVNSVTSGKILFNGQDINSFNKIERAKKLAALSQKTSLAFDLMIEDVIELGLYPYHLNRVFREEIINDLLKEFSLLEYKHRLYSTLSGGEQQRVQMARVFAQLHLKPGSTEKLLLLDEHVSHLDPHFQHASFMTIKRLAAINNLAVIAVVHDLMLAVEYADKMLLLNNGKMITYGKVNEVITNKNMLECFNMSLIGDVQTGFKLSPAW